MKPFLGTALFTKLLDKMPRKAIKIKRDTNLSHGGRRHLPLPTGPFKVIGCRDLLTGLSKSNGTLLRIYYPADNQDRDIRSQCLMWPNWLAHENYRKGYAEVAGIKWNPLVKMISWLIGEAFIPCIPNAKPLRLGPGVKFPVIVFSHGLGGCRTSYSSLCLEFASHGFVVAAVEHRDSTACATFYAKEQRISMVTPNPESINKIYERNRRMKEDEEGTVDSGVVDDDPAYIPARIFEPPAFIPITTMEWIPYKDLNGDANLYSIRNKQVHQRVHECSRALDLLVALNTGYDVQNILDQLLDPSEFEELLDVDKAVVMGHSFGGATTIIALGAEPRFQLGVCLDGWMYPIRKESFDLVTQPLLFINLEEIQSNANLKIIRDILAGPKTRTPSPIGNKPSSSSFYNDYNEDNQIDRRVITIKGTVHYNQSDAPFVLNWFMKMMFGGKSKRSPFTAHDLTATLALDFISKHLHVLMPEEKEVYLNLQKKKLTEGLPSKL